MPCAICGHGHDVHDYSNQAADFAPCKSPGCKCEDWQEVLGESDYLFPPPGMSEPRLEDTPGPNQHHCDIEKAGKI